MHCTLNLLHLTSCDRPTIWYTTWHAFQIRLPELYIPPFHHHYTNDSKALFLANSALHAVPHHNLSHQPQTHLQMQHCLKRQRVSSQKSLSQSSFPTLPWSMSQKRKSRHSQPLQASLPKSFHAQHCSAQPLLPPHPEQGPEAVPALACSALPQSCTQASGPGAQLRLLGSVMAESWLATAA